MGKVLILMVYYNRPILVKNALQSIIKANQFYSDWELVFGDDNSKIPGEPIAREILHNYLSKVKFARSSTSLEEKIEKGLNLGWYINKFINESDADYVITLCDDDELHPNYLKNLDDYFINNNDIMYCYSNVILYNPLKHKSNESTLVGGTYNRYKTPINAAGKLDGSQVAWRTKCNKEMNIWFSETTKIDVSMPWAGNIDQMYFQSLYDKCGPCQYTGFVSQYKGIHDYQAVWHKKVDRQGLLRYNSMLEQFAGEKF